MLASTIIVQYSSGTPAKRVRVSMSLECGGSTGDFFTDNYGMAIVEHSSSGRATVYVQGHRYGTFHAPGKYAVTIQS